MLKLTIAVLTIALAGTASAAGWRSLRVDASSEANFAKSVAAFQDKLPASRQHAFERALQDIWVQGSNRADAEQREYTASEYFAQLDGLGYEEVVTLLDPTGERAQQYRAEHASLQQRVAPQKAPWPDRPAPMGFNGNQERGQSPSTQHDSFWRGRGGPDQ